MVLRVTFDVIIVNYYSAERLQRLLPLIQRFMADAQLYVVNNSPDAPVPVDLLTAHGVVYIENGRNVGFAVAVNQALAVGTGDAVVLVNPDVVDIQGPSLAITQAFECDERLGALAVRLLNPDGTLQHSCRREPTFLDLLIANVALPQRILPRWELPRRFRMLDWPHDERRYVDAACGAFLVLRRETIRAIGDLDERYFVYWEETDWLLRARLHGWRTLFVPEITAVHVGTDSSSQAVDVPLLLIESQLRFTRERYGRQGEWTLRLALLGIDGLRYVRNRAAVATGHAPAVSTNSISRRLRLYVRGVPVRTPDPLPNPRAPD